MDGASAIVLEGLALELLGHALRNHVKPDKPPPRRLQLARQIIHERFTEPITVTEIARTIGAHPV